MNQLHLITRNVIWLLGGQLFGRALRAAVVIYAASALGAYGWGAFSYALSVATFLTVFSDIGINALLTRESSKDAAKRDGYLSAALFIKIFILAILGILVIVFKDNLTKIPEAAALMPIMVAVFVFDSLRDLGAAIARSLEKMHIEGLNNVITNAAIATLGFGSLILYPGNLKGLAVAYALGAGFGLLAIIIAIRKYIKKLLRKIDINFIKSILLSAWPFGLLSLMAIIMINTDILMLGWMRSVEEVGFYSAAQKIIQFLYVPPVLIATAFFPSLSRLHGTAGEFRTLFERGLGIILMLAIPLAIGGVIIGDQIINLLYSDEYSASINAFIILATTIVIVFPSILIGNAIFAHDKQRSFLLFIFGGIFGNILFNALLIPLWGIEGAALATLINQFLINIYAWRKMKQINYFTIFRKISKILIAASIMLLTLLALRFSGGNIWINLISGGSVYFLTLYLLKDIHLNMFISPREKSTLPTKTN